MIRPNPIWRSVAILGVAGLVLTACGDDGDTATPKSSDSSSSAPGAKGDGELVIGTLLPQTGSLAFLGPPEFAGVDLALKEINDAGGVNGKPVKKFDSDSGDTKTDTASQSVDRLISNKVDAIIGAASSSVTLSVIDKIVGNGTLQISPANTSDTLTKYDDKGLYFRTAPPDVLQGRVLGDLMLADGNSTVGMLVLQDAYGTGLAASTKKSFEGGGGKVVEQVIYDPAGGQLLHRGRQDQGSRPRGHRDHRVRGDQEDHPRAREAGHRPEDEEDLLRRRQPGQLHQGLPGGHTRRRQGHPARCRLR